MFKAGLDRRELKAVKFDVKKYTPDLLRKIIREETGYNLDLQDKRLQVVALANKEDMAVRFGLAAFPVPAGASLVSSR